MLKFYTVMIDARHGHAVAEGQYFNHAVDAWRCYSPECGYMVKITVYRGTEYIKSVTRYKAWWEA